MLSMFLKLEIKLFFSGSLYTPPNFLLSFILSDQRSDKLRWLYVREPFDQDHMLCLRRLFFFSILILTSYLMLLRHDLQEGLVPVVFRSLKILMLFAIFACIKMKLLVVVAKFEHQGWRGGIRWWEGVSAFLHWQSRNWFNWIICSLIFIFEQCLWSYHSRLNSEFLLSIVYQLQLSKPSPWLHADSTYDRSWTTIIGVWTLVMPYFSEMMLSCRTQVAFWRWFRLFCWINYYVVWGGRCPAQDSLLLPACTDWYRCIDEVFLRRRRRLLVVRILCCCRCRWIEEVTVNYLLGLSPWRGILCLCCVAFCVQKDLSTLVCCRW